MIWAFAAPVTTPLSTRRLARGTDLAAVKVIAVGACSAVFSTSKVGYSAHGSPYTASRASPTQASPLLVTFTASPGPFAGALCRSWTTAPAAVKVSRSLVYTAPYAADPTCVPSLLKASRIGDQALGFE